MKILTYLKRLVLQKTTRVIKKPQQLTFYTQSKKWKNNPDHIFLHNLLVTTKHTNSFLAHQVEEIRGKADRRTGVLRKALLLVNAAATCWKWTRFNAASYAQNKRLSTGSLHGYDTSATAAKQNPVERLVGSGGGVREIVRVSGQLEVINFYLCIYNIVRIS